MNRRISDLLDAYRDDSVELSGNTPLSSARIKELTMNKINGTKTVKKATCLTTRLLPPPSPPSPHPPWPSTTPSERAG